MNAPHYSAALLDWESGEQLGPIDASTPHAEDNDVKAVALMNAFTWCTENGVDRVRVQIVKDGTSLGVFSAGPQQGQT